MEAKVKVNQLSKKYSLYNKQTDKLADLFLPFKKKKNRTFYALKDISFEVNQGETIGVIGLNGSGKSTLSNILAGVTEPTTGSLKVDGEASLLAVNVGLNPQLTGVENIELKCLMLGFKKQEINVLKPDIIEFADIGEFINQPVKDYSSGMKSRLGFGISAYTNPDVLIIDEALAVGDTTFYHKCLEKINEFKSRGKTIFFISHAVGQMKNMCDKVMWLHYGELIGYGNAEDVLKEFQAFNQWFNNLEKSEKKHYRNKMLKEQNHLGARTRVDRSRKIKRKHPKNIAYVSQILLLTIIVIYSGLYMFLHQPPVSYLINLLDNGQLETGQSDGSSINQNAQKKVTTSTNTIDEKAVVDTDSASLYTDQSLEEKAKQIAFGKSVFVEKQVGNVYKIRYQGHMYYMPAEEASFGGDGINTDFRLSDLRSILPDPLTSSYEFFFAFIGSDYDKIKSKLRGLSSEEQTDGGKILHYDGYDFAYTINKTQVATGFIVTNLHLSDKSIQSIKSNATLMSKDGNEIFIRTKDYDVVVNLKDAFLKVQQR